MRFKHIKAAILLCLIIISALGAVYAEGESGSYIIKFSHAPVWPSNGDGTLTPVIPSENIYAAYKVTNEYISRLYQSGEAEYIEPDGIASIPENEAALLESTEPDFIALMSEDTNDYIPNDPFFTNQWGTQMINAPYAWSKASFDGSVKIGIIDTGDPSRHPDITSNIAESKDYTGSGVYDTSGHSTFVSGIIAADMNNSMGTAGILPRVQIIPLKAFEDREATISVIARALNDAVDIYGCDVINMSLTYDADSSTLREAVNKALDSGAIVVAAVGNDGTGKIYYPAAYDGVIGVGSVTRTKTRAVNSQYNETVDAAAPGSGVYSTTLNNYSGRLRYSYGSGSGTSYAAPHITAAAAIAKGYDRNINSDGFLEILAQTCEHLGDDGKNPEFGYGLLDLRAMTDYFTPSATSAPGSGTTNGTYFSSFSPNFTASFDGATVSVQITSSSDCRGTLRLASYSEDQTGGVMLYDILSADVSVSAGGTVTSTFSGEQIKIDPEAARSYLKLLYWDENQSPLAKAYTYEIKY